MLIRQSVKRIEDAANTLTGKFTKKQIAVPAVVVLARSSGAKGR